MGKGEDMISGISLKELYQCYQEIGYMELCVRLVKMLVDRKKEMHQECMPTTWEECQGRIALRLIHSEWN